MRTVTILLLGLICVSCTDPFLPELEPNVLGAENLVCFTNIQTISQATSETRADVTITFESVYDQLTPAQQARITGMEVNGGTGIASFTLPAEENELTLKQLRIGQPYHLTLQLLSDDAHLPVTDVRFRP